ncbi:unnamed protein product [Trichobilharzia regenti]|nr:unnamed protein product [Trichobilharzia regenti]
MAYRLEPLLLKHYASISPVVIPKASLSHLEKFLSIKDTLSNSISNLTSVSRITSLVGSGRSSGRSDTTTTSSNKSSSKESPHSDTPTLKGSDSSHSDVESLNSLQTVDLSDSGSSDESDTSNEKTPDDEQERRVSESLILMLTFFNIFIYIYVNDIIINIVPLVSFLVEHRASTARLNLPLLSSAVLLTCIIVSPYSFNSSSHHLLHVTLPLTSHSPLPFRPSFPQAMA